MVRLKGKTRAVRVFEPLAGDLDGDYVSRYDAAYAALEHDDPGARSLFDALQAERPMDAVVAFHLARIASGASGIEVLFTEK